MQAQPGYTIHGEQSKDIMAGARINWTGFSPAEPQCSSEESERCFIPSLYLLCTTIAGAIAWRNALTSSSGGICCSSQAAPLPRCGSAAQNSQFTSGRRSSHRTWRGSVPRLQRNVRQVYDERH